MYVNESASGLRLDALGFELDVKVMPLVAVPSVREVREGAEDTPSGILADDCGPPADMPCKFCSSTSNGASFARRFRSSKNLLSLVEGDTGLVGDVGLDTLSGSPLVSSSSNSTVVTKDDQTMIPREDKLTYNSAGSERRLPTLNHTRTTGDIDDYVAHLQGSHAVPRRNSVEVSDVVAMARTVS